MDKSLVEKICEALGVSTSNENVEKLENLISPQFPKCNHCAKVIENIDARWDGPLKFSTNWGFESANKDCMTDSWVLCAECRYVALAKWPLICASCRKTIPEVMADLDHRNPHHLYYGDYQAALNRYLDPKTIHCGFEYALIENRVICEICYERFITKFEIPMKVSIEMGGIYENTENVDKKSDLNDPYPGRLAQLFNIEGSEDHGDFIREMHDARVSYEDACRIRRSPDADQRLLKATVSIYREPHRDRFEDAISLSFGDNSHKEIALLYFRSVAGRDLDFTQVQVSNEGHSLVLGNFEFEAKTLRNAAELTED